jgi:hypothetical protein
MDQPPSWDAGQAKLGDDEPPAAATHDAGNPAPDDTQRPDGDDFVRHSIQRVYHRSHR